MAPAFSLGSMRAYNSRFAVGVLEDGFDHHVGTIDPAALDIRLQAGQLLSRLAGNAAALLEEGPGAIERGLHELGAAVLQRHGEAAQRTPRRDVAAHHARTDDVHVAARRQVLAAQCLQSFLQEEHAHQVA